MAKAVAIIKELPSGANKGAPDIVTPYSGFVYIGPLPGAYAIYVIAATGAQLTSIQLEANCIGGLLITDTGVRWPELDQAIPAGLRTKINTYRTGQGLGSIPAGTTLFQVARFAANIFDFGLYDVFDGN